MNRWRHPGTAAALVVAVAVLLLALVSASGTSAVDVGVGWIPGYDWIVDQPPPESDADDEGDDETPPLITAIAVVSLSVIILVMLLLFGFGLAILIGALRLQVLLRRRRRKVVQHGDEVEPEEEPMLEARGLVRSAVRGALAELRARAGGPPADAVVAAWVVLEGAAAKAGSARQAHQTPTEFTAAVLAEHTVDKDALRRLCRLYQRARFGTATVLTEADVADAEADLETLVGDLAGSARGLTGSNGDLTESDSDRAGGVGGLTGGVGGLTGSRW
jgi:Domain of unknown function (DUF4129)